MKIMHAAAVATIVAGLVAGASAQTATMPKDTMAKGDSMAMAKSPTSYTGCVEAGSTAGSYILTHFSADAMMRKESMAKDGMKADAMKKDAMAKDSMAKDTMKADAMKDGMKKDTMAKDAVMKDSMMSEHLMLTGTAVNLQPHVGHKVTVAGKGADKMSFAVSTVKMVASSCQ